MAKQKLLSGRVKVTPAANVTADRYEFLGLEQAEPNLGVAPQDGYVLIYDSNAPGKRNWSSSSLLSGGLTAQSAFDTANSASSYANSSFIVSNSAAIYANSAFISANAASSYANGAFITANSASNYANASFETANSAGVYANAAFSAANSASSYANGAFAAANTADQKAVSAGSYANSAYQAANSAGSYANGAFASANNKLPLTGGTITGDLSVAGNLTISGNTTYVSVNTLNVSDPIIYLAANNYSSDIVGIGFVGNYNDGTTNRHAGLIRMEASNTFYLFTNYDSEFDTNTLNIANPSLFEATLKANVVANTVLIRNIDVLDRTNSSYIQANAAFDSANTADQKAVTSGTYANAAFGIANSGSSYANGAFAKANTANTLAQAAFDAANNATDTWVRQAANSASSYANGAFVAANTADQKAVSAGSYANSAYIHANAAFNAANNATDTWVRNAANSASSYANSGYIHANSAFDKANAGYNLINGAFGVSVTLDSFTGDSSCTTFTLSTTPSGENYTLITLNGITQHKSAYNLSGANVVFSEAPNTNVSIDVVTFTSSAVQKVGVSITVDTFTGTGACTQFTLSTTPTDENYTMVAIDGVSQSRNAYNVSTSVVTFSEAPGSGSLIEVTTFQSADAYASNTLAQLAFNQANTANILAQAAFNAANNATDTWVRNAANSASSYANSAFGVANSASSYANGAFAAANTADQKAVSAGSYANSAYQTANSASSYANGAFAAANTKLSSSGGTVSGDLVVSGNLTVSGNVTTISANNLIVNDNMIYLNDANNSSNVDLGIAGNYNDGAYKHTGLFRDASDGTWKFYYNYLPEPDAAVNIDTSNSSFLIANLTANLISDVAIIRGYDPINHTNSAYQAANSAGSYANGAFAAANTADQKAVSAGSYANSAFGVANSASSYANGAFAQANTGVTNAAAASSYANSAFGVANSSSSYANGAFGVANSASSYANGAFVQANTGVTNAAAASSYANSAYQTANSASSYANGAFSKANTANTLAQAAFDKANTGGGSGTDSWARDASNAASSYANSAYLHANAAFNAANTGGAATDSFARNQANAAFNTANSAASGGQLIYVAAIDTFTSNGQNTVFTLSTTPTSANQIMVYIDGVYQQTSAYTLSGSTLTMSGAVDANSTLQVRTFANTATSQLGVTIDTFTGTGACTTFTLSTVPTSKNLTSVIVGGVPQLKSSYSITGTSLVFTGAPANNASIEVSTYKGGGSYATSFTAKVDKFTGNGAQTTFGLSTIPNSENETFVYLNGVYQNKDTYSVSGANVILTGTATSNDVIEVVTVAGSEMNVTSSRYNSRVYTGTGACTQFTISSSHTANSVLVFENGICQEPITDYTVSGTTLTFTTAPANGVKIQIRELPV